MATLTNEQKALLETIAGPESAGNYGVIYGGDTFDDFSDHPRKPVLITSGPNKGKYSSAAGKYQFLGSTWDDIAGRYGLDDFSPANQDAGAWALASEEYRRDTGRDLAADLAAGDLSRIPGSLRNQWTSMPGGIEQGITLGGFNSAYAKALGGMKPMPIDPRYDTGQSIKYVDGVPMPQPRPGQRAAPQGPDPRNTDYMNALSARYDTGQSRLPSLPAIGPTGGPPLNSAPVPLPRGAGAAARTNAMLNKPTNAMQQLQQLVQQGVHGITNPIQNAIANNITTPIRQGFVDPLKKNLGQAFEAAMGNRPANIGMSLGTASNGGNVVQGANGLLNSTTQQSDAWRRQTGQGRGSNFDSDDRNDSIAS